MTEAVVGEGLIVDVVDVRRLEREVKAEDGNDTKHFILLPFYRGGFSITHRDFHGVPENRFSEKDF